MTKDNYNGVKGRYRALHKKLSGAFEDYARVQMWCLKDGLQNYRRLLDTDFDKLMLDVDKFVARAKTIKELADKALVDEND